MTIGEQMIEMLENAGYRVCHDLPREEASDGDDFHFLADESGVEWFEALSPEGNSLLEQLRAVRLSPHEELEAAESPSAMCP
jgi:hypothetical protein